MTEITAGELYDWLDAIASFSDNNAKDGEWIEVLAKARAYGLITINEDAEMFQTLLQIAADNRPAYEKWIASLNSPELDEYMNPE